ncbi:endonuclease III domain-containing protein [Methanobacterium petrolearium]|uniref:endonuclease III domain-containing protein n=1 Tax=Methanobacterium petrolearium TaxID=710190 RepID=UPI001AE1BE52|nr:endonuclease III [Methanobacterium petrolearium]MBP1945427.1 endonuclease-3 [Methanobacterium petrolearium]BDZ71625.1 endonuclease III [Methanobacterium petrolearium]
MTINPDVININNSDKTIDTVMERLQNLYDLRVFEDGDPYRVLIRTILSQRTRDDNTDRASAQLFSKYKTIEDIANADPTHLEPLIRPAGFYHVKAKRIVDVSNELLDDFKGKVPNNIKDLLKLPGVGRKTANCVLVYGFQIPAIPVDVHVHRISNRLGLVNTKTPEETEEKLIKLVPKEYWIELNDLMVQFGQTICRPQNPLHEQCPLQEICDFYQDIAVKMDINK